MSSWRDHILQHFREPVQRLTLVADPDGLDGTEGADVATVPAAAALPRDLDHPAR